MKTKTKKRTTRADCQRAWRAAAYKHYANRATFKSVPGFPATALHNRSVRIGMLDYLLKYVDQHGNLPRGKHQVKMGQLDGFGYQSGEWEVNFPSIHPFNRSSFGENS